MGQIANQMLIEAIYKLKEKLKNNKLLFMIHEEKRPWN